MIPESFWTLIRRWFWLIGFFAVIGGVAGALAIPRISGDSSNFHASVTLGIRRVISPAGSTHGGTSSTDIDLLADYTTSVARRAKTPQFVALLHDRLTKQGFDIPEIYLRDKYVLTDDRGLSRLTIDAQSNAEALAEAIADTVASLLIEEVTGEETRLRQNISASLDSERTELLSDLGKITSARLARLDALGDDKLQETIDNVVRRGIGTNLPEEARTILADLLRISGDPDLAVLDSRERAIQEELANLASLEQALATDVRGDPVVVLNPVTTAEQLTPGTRTRNAAILGLLGGAVIGWILANMADAGDLRIRIPRRSRRTTPKHRVDEWASEPHKEEVLS